MSSYKNPSKSSKLQFLMKTLPHCVVFSGCRGTQRESYSGRAGGSSLLREWESGGGKAVKSERGVAWRCCWTSVEERFLATFVSSDTSGWRTSLRCDTSAWRTLGGVVVLVGPLYSAVTLQHSHLCQSQPLNWHLGQYCEI